MTFSSAIRAAFRIFAGTLLLAATAAPAQTLPPAPLTSAPLTSAPVPPAPVQSSSPAPSAAGRAQVQFANGLLTVNATDSSLNQILRDVARMTGMTISGGVRDERVFGTYGPADTGAVLAILLNGTGSNMVLLESHTNSPRELVLTPRQGGPTPPSPNTYRDPEPEPMRNISPREDLPPQQSPPPAPPQQPAATSVPTPDAVQPQNSSDSSAQQSPNGVKTPQQIYEELMKLQQKNTVPPPQ